MVLECNHMWHLILRMFYPICSTTVKPEHVCWIYQADPVQWRMSPIGWVPLHLSWEQWVAVGSASQDDSVINPMMGSPVNMHATASVAEGVCQQEKYSLLVCIFTPRDRWALEPHAWAEDLLKDFFQLILGINLSVTLLSPTECLIFCGNCTQGQGMSWDESLHCADQLKGIHPDWKNLSKMSLIGENYERYLFLT